jgi:hypothetical protein
MLNSKQKDEKLEEYLKDLCIKNLKNLMEQNLIEKCDLMSMQNAEIKPTQNGRLMAKYCLAYDTIKTLINELGFHTSNSAESDENSKLYYSFEDNDHMVQKSKTLIDLV